MRIALVIVGLLVVAGGTVVGLAFAGVIRVPGLPSRSKAAPKSATAQHENAALSIAPATKPAPVPPRRTEPSPTPPSRPTPPITDPEVDKKLVRLASIYDQIPAEEAADIFRNLPDPLIESLLRRMDERQVGKLLLALERKRAARITAALSR